MRNKDEFDQAWKQAFGAGCLGVKTSDAKFLFKVLGVQKPDNLETRQAYDKDELKSLFRKLTD